MKKAFIITVSLLSCAVLVLGGFLYSSQKSLNNANTNLENVYQRSFYDLVNNVNNMEVEVSKLMVTNDGTSQQKSLAKLKQQTSDVENNLSFLPVNMNILEKTTRFMNQLNGYCTTLITYKDGILQEKDFETIKQVHSSISNIKQELNEVIQKIMNGYKITQNLDNGSDEADFSLSFSGLGNDTIEYPSLIYDGPFSDSVVARKIKGLEKQEITMEEAKKKVIGLFGNENIVNLSYLGLTNGIFETYDFNLTTNDMNYFIQITKRGGFLLTISANTQDVVKNKDVENSTAQEDSVKSESVNNVTNKVENAITSAVNFAKKLNLENMQCVWSAHSQNVCYVNLAPVIDDIIMYPDLIKVKINFETGDVIGWEACNYAYNHVERADLIPQLTEDEAKKLVSKNLEVDTIKLCVIPLDYIGETLSYEFAGKYNNNIYYVYLDADTGAQVRVLRVVQTENGDLVL